MKSFPRLTTERLILRQLSERDVEEIFFLRSDTFINRYLDRKPCSTLIEALDFIKMIKKNKLLYWAIAQKDNDKLIGTICVFDVSQEQRKCEIGFELLTQFQGKGIMREAAKEIIEYSTRILGIKTIDAQAHRDNQSSANLLRVSKFRYKGSVDEKKSELVLFRLITTGE